MAGDPFFVAERVDSQVSGHLTAGYGVLIVTSGEGLLTDEAGVLAVRCLPTTASP